MLSKSFGGRVCGAVACVWLVRPVHYQNHAWATHRTRGAAQGPSKPRNLAKCHNPPHPGLDLVRPEAELMALPLALRGRSAAPVVHEIELCQFFGISPGGYMAIL